MKKLIKRGVCVALATSMAISLMGCNIKDILNGNFGGDGGNTNSGAAITDASNSEKAKDLIYKEVKEINLGWPNISSVAYREGRVFCYNVDYDSSAYDEYWNKFDWDKFQEEGEDYSKYDEFAANAPEVKTTCHVASMNATGDDVKEMSFDLEDGSYIMNFAPASADSFYLIMQEYVSDKTNYYVQSMDFNGNVIGKTEIPNLSSEDYMYIQSAMTDKAGNLIVGCEKYMISYDKNGNKLGSLDLAKNGTDGWLNYIVPTNNGRVFYTYYDNSAEKQVIKELDVATMTDKGEATFPTTNMLSMSGDLYDAYYSKNDGTFVGYNFDKNEAVDIFSPFDSDLDPYKVNYPIQTDETHIIASVYSDEGAMYSDVGDSKLYLYEKVNPEDVKDKTIITLGCLYMDSAVTSKVLNFNKNSDDYKIRIVDYGEFNTTDDYTKAGKQLDNDIISGKAPDIVIMDSNTNVAKYVDKKVFADLKPLIEQDPEIELSDLNENIIKLCSSDNGELCVLIPSFGVSSYYMKKSVAGSGKLTLNDLRAAEQKYNTLAFRETTKEQVLYDMISYSYDAFLDVKKGKCDFENQTFIDALEYANQYPAEINYDDLYSDENYYTQYQYAMRNNTALINYTWLDDLKNYKYQEMGYAGEEIILTGFPMEGSSGAFITAYKQFGIMKSCKETKAAWDFLREFLASDYQDELMYEIPLSNKAMQKKMELAQKRPFWTNEDGSIEEYDQTYWLDDKEIIIDPMTAAEAQKVVDYINSVDKFYFYNEEIMNIIKEEAAPYFAGQKSAKDVASVIQGRVQIYVNENK